jgi:hypothetical protein
MDDRTESRKKLEKKIKIVPFIVNRDRNWKKRSTGQHQKTKRQNNSPYNIPHNI